MLMREGIPVEVVAQLFGIQSNEVKLVGSGGFKTVFVLEVETRKIVIKFVQTSFYDMENREVETFDSLKKRTLREIEILKRFNSKYLPTYCDIYFNSNFEYNQAAFVIFCEEYIGTNNVRQIIGSSNNNEVEAIKLLHDVTSALDLYFHEGKIIHRDIKPENIMKSDRDGCYVLIDPGVHYTPGTSKLTSFGSPPMGTRQYYSPEQLMSARPDLDCRSDFYSLGLVCYEMIAGRHPFVELFSPMDEDDFHAIVNSTSHVPLCKLDGIQVGQKTSDLVDSLLHKKKIRRPRTPEILLNRVKELAT